MPHKTKAHKIRKDKRGLTSPKETTPIKRSTLSYDKNLDSQEIATTKATKSDLIKTVIVIGSIFALEFAIFYATLK